MARRRSVLLAVVLLVAWCSSARAQVPVAYQIDDLGSMGGDSLVGIAINAHGDVAGYAQLPDFTYRAFRWTRAGGLEDLGANGGPFAQAFGINDNGDVVGVYFDEFFNGHGFIAPAGGTMQDLLTFERPIQFAASITNDGRLAGTVATPAASHAFRLLPDGSLHDLGDGDRPSNAADINEAGDVAGTEWQSASPLDPIRAFRYSDALGKVYLGSLGGSKSAGLALNGSGVVVGWAADAADVGRAFRARPGHPMEDLGTLGGNFPQSGAESINDHGAIVGYTTSQYGWTAFVYTDQTGMVDLNTRIPPPAEGWRGLNDARAINNAGHIVVEYSVVGRIGTYLLTPIFDTTAPVISSASATPDELRPPNGRMERVTLGVSATDDFDPAPVCAISGVIDSEAPATGPNPSVTITGPFTLELQASRRGSSTDRAYTITVACRDASANVSTTSVVVTVPHDSREN